MSALPEAIFRKWRHSREEDREGLTVYRGEEFSFPPARGRDGIEFRPDGTFTEWAIGAGDAQRGIPGRWQAAGPDRLRITFDDPARPARDLHIVEVGPGVLKTR